MPQRTLSNDTRFDHDEFVEVLADIATGAAHRDRTHTLPRAEVKALLATNFGAVRAHSASSEHDLVQLFNLVLALARADANIAHIFRNHFQLIENSLDSTLPAETAERVLELAANGLLLTAVHSELGNSPSGSGHYATTLTSAGSSTVLSGKKFYSTGSLYADWLVVAAEGPNGPSNVLIPANRPGVEVIDDWDGFGQTLTGSGTTVLDRVAVDATEIHPATDVTAPYRSTFPQLYLTAVAAGIAANILDDAIALIKARQRNFHHGTTALPRDEPALQETIGKLTANMWAARAVVLDAARTLDQARVAGVPDVDDAQASLAACNAKYTVESLALFSANLLFEVGGATAVRAESNLDRHWRNLRTLAAHNPSSYKLRAVGDLQINGVSLPSGAYF